MAVRPEAKGPRSDLLAGIAARSPAVPHCLDSDSWFRGSVFSWMGLQTGSKSENLPARCPVRAEKSHRLNSMQDKKRYLAFKLKRAACQLKVLFQDYRFPDWQGSNVSDVVTASLETTVYSVQIFIALWIFLTSEASSSGIDKDGAAH